MIDLSPEWITVIMLGFLLAAIMSGYPLAIPIGAVSLIMGYLLFGESVLSIIYSQVFGLLHNYVLLAIPLFVFMGMMLEYSGIADRMYEALFLWLSGFRGGLAIITVLIGTVLAACVGIMSASVSMLTIIGLRAMVKRGYDKALASGAVCAGGSLGILIPPSVMLVIYGPMARISVGKLFMGAFIPGFLLSVLYCSYIAIRCYVQPNLAPTVPSEERAVPFLKKTKILIYAIAPTALIIMAVLGAIFLGIAPPTEAAAVGGFAALLLTLFYRKLNWHVMKNTVYRTVSLACMVMFIGAMSVAYTGIFLKAGCGEVVQNFVLAAPGGKWGSFAVVMFIYFILGFFIEFLGIFFIMVPIMAPLAPILGFDPIWFGIMICVNLQMSFLTPPYAFAIFVLRGTVDPSLGVTTADVIRGVFPFVGLIVIALVLCAIFPQLITWLPGLMIK